MIRSDFNFAARELLLQNATFLLPQNALCKGLKVILILLKKLCLKCLLPQNELRKCLKVIVIFMKKLF